MFTARNFNPNASHAMYRILVRNRTDHILSLAETSSIPAGMGRVVATTDDILVADRLAAVVGVAAILDFPPEQRRRFVVTATEFGCELDHPDHGRVSVTILDTQALEIGRPARVARHAPSACDN